MKKKVKNSHDSSLDAKEFKKELIEEDKIIKKEESLIAKEEKIVVKEEKTMFQSLSALKRHHQVLFSIIIVIAVVLVWRGMWNLVDEYWFPSVSDFSNISSVVVGVIILLITRKAVNQLAGGL
jgi:hypothetical protein